MKITFQCTARAAAWVAAAALAIAAPGCDPNAKANSNGGALFSKDRLSREHESCSATSDCAEELRCLQRTCQTSESSIVGDYHAAVGARSLAAGEVEAAIGAYTAAVNRYKSDDKKVPTALHCAHGRALVAASSEPQLAEGAARALDQCLRDAPVGSALHEDALSQLAVLGRVGLDPEHLGSGESPPRYMTRQPIGPSTDDLAVKASGDVRKKGRSYNDFITLVQSASARTRLIPCWEMNWDATKSKTLTVPVQLKNRFIQGDYEEDDGYALEVESKPPVAGSAQKCVHDVVVALAEQHSKASKKVGPAWAGTVSVTIGD